MVRTPDNTDRFERGTDLLAKPVFPAYRNAKGLIVEPSVNGGLPVAAGFLDDHSHDAFGRLRVSQPFQIFDAIPLYNSASSLRDIITVNGTITQVGTNPVYNMAVTSEIGSRALSQSRMYLPYTPGKSQLIVMTANMGLPETAVVKRVGYFDDFNGVFFQLSQAGMSVAERSNVSGAVVGRFTFQKDWNIDPLNGTGPSGITADFSKAHIYLIDFQWLGVGRIRYAMNIGGVIVPVHESVHANIDNTVFMATPHLPVRYEILNQVGGGSGGSMTRFCASAITEGGTFPAGETFVASLGTALNSVTVREAILGIRLLSSFGGRVNNRKLFLDEVLVISDGQTVFYEVVRVRAPESIGGTWLNVNEFSSAQYSFDPSYVEGTINDSVITVAVGYVPAITQGSQKTPGAEQRSVANARAFDNVIVRGPFSNISDLYLLYVTSVPGTATNVGAAFRWIEYD